MTQYMKNVVIGTDLWTAKKAKYLGLIEDVIEDNGLLTFVVSGQQIDMSSATVAVIKDYDDNLLWTEIIKGTHNGNGQH